MIRSSNRKNDIDTLISSLKDDYLVIENLYNESLDKKAISPSLQIKIKNYLENARSVFDYCAHDIADIYGITAARIYFPFIEKTSNSIGFQGSVGRNLPGLKQLNKAAFDYIQSIQPYNQAYFWLADFVTITNDHKHQGLVPQKRIESKSLQISRGNVSLKMSGNSKFQISSNAKFVINGVEITNETITPESDINYLNSRFPELDIKQETWVDFKFGDTVSALPLIKKIHDEVPVIINHIYTLI